MSAFYYTAYGLNIFSEFELPFLLPGDSTATIDVYIQRNATDAQWKKTPLENHSFVGGIDTLLFKAGDCTYYVTQGCRIELDYIDAPSFDMELMKLYLMGSAIGAILYQRGYLVIHGNAIVTSNGKAILFAGPSGIGKSTLAEAFRKAGFSILSDDVCAIRFDENQLPWILPAYPALKLWKETAEAFAHEPQTLRAVANRIEKFHIPVTTHFHNQSIRVSKLVCLMPAENSSKSIIKGSEAWTLLYQNLYRPQFIKLMSLDSVCFKNSAYFCQHVQIQLLPRPPWPYSNSDLKNLLSELEG